MQTTYCPFIKLYGSWVNLQHIARLEIEEDSRLMVLVHWASGNTHCYKDGDAEILIEALDRITRNRNEITRGFTPFTYEDACALSRRPINKADSPKIKHLIDLLKANLRAMEIAHELKQLCDGKIELELFCEDVVDDWLTILIPAIVQAAGGWKEFREYFYACLNETDLAETMARDYLHDNPPPLGDDQ